jgi:hypothetical protein
VSAQLIRPRFTAPLAACGLLLLAAHSLGLLAVLLPAVPLLFLLASLLFGLYPGCDAALRLAERIADRNRPRGAVARNWRRPRLPLSHTAHGGLLLALSLSGRAPPA